MPAVAGLTATLSPASRLIRRLAYRRPLGHRQFQPEVFRSTALLIQAARISTFPTATTRLFRHIRLRLREFLRRLALQPRLPTVPLPQPSFSPSPSIPRASISMSSTNLVSRLLEPYMASTSEQTVRSEPPLA